METLSQIREDVAPFIGDSGVCPDSNDILKAVNDARRILYKLGNWKGTTEDAVVKVIENKITLPYHHDHIISASSYCRTIKTYNSWWIPFQDQCQNFCGSECQLLDMGDRFATFRENKGKRFRVKAYCDLKEDEGKIVEFHIEDEYNQRKTIRRPLKQGCIGEWGGQDAGAVDDAWILRIFQASKPATKGRVLVTVYDPTLEVREGIGITSDSGLYFSDDGILTSDIGGGKFIFLNGPEFVCAIYGANEINPNYKRYGIGCVCESQQIAVHSKLKYTPLVNESDLVDISTEAIIFALQALTARKNRNMNEFNAQILLATTYLNKELASSHPPVSSSIRWHGHSVVDNL